MDLRTLLKNKIAKQKPVTKEESIKTEDEHFQKLLKEWGKDTTQKTKIPKFFNRLPKENEPLRQKLQMDSHTNLLRRKSEKLLKDNELRELWVLLEKNQSFPDEQLMTYADFQKVTSMLSDKIKVYLTPCVFARLQEGDPQGRVSIMSLFNYVMKKTWLHQSRLGLSLYDASGQGYLNASDMENYISDFLPTILQLARLEKSFHSFYICTAVRKFFFHLDVLRAGRIRILDILACSFLDELLELRVEDLSKEIQEQNWFSAPSTLRVYSHYLNLDRDHNGMLSKSELACYGSGTLTQPFLDRVFQVCLTYGGEMDYKTYLDLVLALENRSEPQSLAFLFRILDIKECGYLDPFTLNFFFRAIQEQMKAHGADPVSFEDVKDELFDMVKPKDPEKITLQDLQGCGQGETFVSILIEFHGFWNHENREAVKSEPSQD